MENTDHKFVHNKTLSLWKTYHKGRGLPQIIGNRRKVVDDNDGIRWWY